MKKKVFTVLVALLLLLVVFVFFSCDNFSLFEVLSNDISLIPGEITLNLDETIKFEVSAGISPFVFTEVGDGIVANGIYTAPVVEGNFIISVKDDRNRTAEAFVTVVDAVSLLPEIVSTGIGGILPFTISGGTDPLTVTLDPGFGTIGSITYDPTPDEYYFNYTAVSAGVEIIRVTDNIGQIAEAYVTIDSNPDLMIIPVIVEVVVGDTFQFSASGGVGAYTYTLKTVLRNLDGENFVPATRIYTAPSTVSSPATIRVTDSDTPTPSTAEATIYIVAELLTINPSVALTLYVGNEFTFSASNGNPPYSFSILGDETSGSIDSSTGRFTALVKDPNVTVIVTDGNGNISTCRVKIKN